MSNLSIVTTYSTNTIKVEGAELTQAFEDEAVQWLDDCFGIWRSTGETDWIKTVRAHPALVLECAARDLSNVPTTPDFVLKEPIGFGVFLRLGKNAGRNPSMSIGADPVGAPTMSYGRAIRELGMPDAPGLDWREDGEDVVETVGERQTVEGVAGTMADMQISAEEEPDSQDVKSTLTPGKQWELFSAKKLLADAVNLAAQYAVLVAAKERRLAAERKEAEMAAAKKEKMSKAKGSVILEYESRVYVKPVVDEPVVEKPVDDVEELEESLDKGPLFEPSVGVHGFPGQPGAVPRPESATASGADPSPPAESEGTASSADPTPPAEPEGWPEVEDLTFDGFTNWIQACKDHQKKFITETCVPWGKAKQDRLATIESKITAWSKSPAANSFVSEIVDPDPMSFYDLEPLGVLDAGEQRGKGKGKAKQ